MEIVINNFKCPSWNTYYAGKHWSQRKKKADEIHALVWLSVLEQVKESVPFSKKVKLIYTVCYKDKRRRDADNAAIKFFTDGLVEANILKDDSAEYVDEISIKIKTGQVDNKVIIKII